MGPGKGVEGITEQPPQIPAPYRIVPGCRTKALYRMRRICRMEMQYKTEDAGGMAITAAMAIKLPV